MCYLRTQPTAPDKTGTDQDNILEPDQENRSESGNRSRSRNLMDEDSNFPEEDNEDESVGSEGSGGRRRKQQKHCFNEQCKSTELYKRVKSKVETSKYRTLCKTCHAKYSNGQFCEFCEEIYDDNAANEDDDLIWIGCDSCDRWNHIACEMKCRIKEVQTIKQKNEKYECVNCTNKAKPKPEKPEQPKRPRPKPVEDPYSYAKGVYNTKRRTVRQIYNEQRNQQYQNERKEFVDVFNTARDNFPFLEQFLQNLNKTYATMDYRLCVNDQQIRQDLQRFKTTVGIMVTSSNTQQDDEEKRLKRKKK